MKRGRFAPTPSGPMHLGNALTALLAWLQIRSAKGQFILRIEDIDRQRSKPEHVRQIIEDLRWLGLDWDEGPDIGGPYGPYAQSEREPLYREQLARLLAQGWLYPCYCSRAELHGIANAPHGLGSEGPVYPGTCRNLTEPEQLAKAVHKRPSLRFRLPADMTCFHDLVMGRQQFPPGAGGDFVVSRADGMIGYQLAVVVDDAAMAVTDVLRGLDLLDSTPRQLQLYAALGLTTPRFAHVPLLCGQDGQRLSKRHGSVSLAGLRAAGVPPERIVGRLGALAGLDESPEPRTAADWIGAFDPVKLSARPLLLSQRMLDELAAR